MTRLRETIRNLPIAVVEALTWRAEDSRLNTSLMRISSVPLGLMRSEAKMQHYFNLFRQNRLDMTTLLQSNYGIFSRMLMSVKNGVRPERMDSVDYFDWVGGLLPVQREYSRERQIAAHLAIGLVFKPECKVKKHIKIGANQIGHS